MLIPQKSLSRRALLRGAGACVALPFLDAMVPAQTALERTAAAPRVRLACLEMVHGAAGSSDLGAKQNLWSPAKDGANFPLSYCLEPLAPFRDHLTIVSGTEACAAEAVTPTEIGADHFRSSAVFLTAARPKQTSGPDVCGGVSIDQIYARRCEPETRVASLQLGIEHLDPANSCAFEYNCIYADAISWSAPEKPLLPVINPRVVFERLFGDPHLLTPQGGSLLDELGSAAASLRRDVGAPDWQRVQRHLDSVRDVERRIQAIERRNASGAKRELSSAPLGVPDSWEEHVKLMFDLQALAFASDTTRVTTFKMSHDVSNRIFPGSGVKSPFHTLSHHEERPARLAEFAKLNRYHVSMLPYFLQKLKDTPDGDGTLLDHSLILYGSPMGDSQTHNHRRLPLLLAGGAGGQLRGNMHRTCAEGTPLANVLLTILRKLGEPIERFGDSTEDVAV